MLIKMEAAALPEVINPNLVLAHARAWAGTPYAANAALRHVGADCIGLVRGLARELCALDVPAPGWRSDWACAGTPILEALRRWLIAVPLDQAQPGHLITHRIGPQRAAHLGVLTPGGLIHAAEVGGTQETAALHSRPVTSAWALPAPRGCVTGPADLTPDECLATVLREPAGHVVEVTRMTDGALLSRSAPYPSKPAALAVIDPIYPNIECME